MVNWLKLFAVTICGVMALALPQRSFAKPLSSEACVELVNEHAMLLKAGVEAYMKRDPAKASSTLRAEQLANIDRFLFIEGQIRFRCPEMELPGLDTPLHSAAQAAAFKERAEKEAEARKAAKQKAAGKKSKGPDIPLPDRNPKRQTKAAG